MNIIPLIFKYWKTGGIMILIAAFLLALHFARSRGAEIAALEAEQEKFRRQIIEIEKARQDEKERNTFRKKQNRKIRLADDAGLRDAYDRLRERAAGRNSR